jgi:hypothetical protein
MPRSGADEEVSTLPGCAWSETRDWRSTLWHPLHTRHFQETVPIEETAPEMMSVVPIVVRVSVILLAIAATAGYVAYLDALWWHALGLTATMARNVSPATLVLLTADAIVAVTCSVLSVVLVLHEGPRAGAARALGASFGAWSYLMAYAGVTMLFRPDPGSLRAVFEGQFLFVEVIGLAGLLRFTALFPRPLGPEELEPSETLPRVLLPFHRASVFMRRPLAPWSVGMVVLISLWGWTIVSGGEISDAGLSPIMDVVRFLAAGLVVMNVRRAWGAATEGDRDGLTWLVAGLSFLLGSLSLLIGGNVLVAVTGFPEPDVSWRPILLDLGMIGFLVMLAMSVLYRGPTDPAQTTRSIATATAVVTAGLFLAAGLEAFFTGGVLAAYALPGGVGTAISFAVVLSTYRGLIRFIERTIPSS